MDKSFYLRNQALYIIRFKAPGVATVNIAVDGSILADLIQKDGMEATAAQGVMLVTYCAAGVPPAPGLPVGAGFFMGGSILSTCRKMEHSSCFSYSPLKFSLNFKKVFFVYMCLFSC